MEGLILIAVIWFFISSLKKGKKSAGSGKWREWVPKPNPAARPFDPQRPAIPQKWSEILTMLTDEQSNTQPQQAPGEEGAFTKFPERSGSLTGPTMLEDAPAMMGDEGASTEYSERSGSLTGPAMLKGAPTMMGDEGADYEGRDLPDERSAAALALSKSEKPGEAPARAARLGPAALREAVVWSEILAKPKALRRAVR